MKKLLQAKTFIIPAMRAGLCEYSDERVLVSNETLAKMAKTCYGIPLIMPEHVDHEELKNNLEQYLCGRVADMHFDEKNDVWLAHCVAETEEALDLFNKGWGVSTSYQVEQKGNGGTLNAVEYNSEILDGTYLHLAIVEHPRYEMAKNPTFYNSKDSDKLTQESAPSTILVSDNPQGDNVMSFWRTKREEVKENTTDIEIEIDGEKIALNTLIATHKAVKLNAAKKNEEKEEEIKNKKKNEEEDEEKMNAEVDALLKDLEKDDKKNEDDEEDKDNEDDKDEDDKDNEDEEMKKEEEKKEASKKKNARFNELKNSRDNSVLDNALDSYKTIQERAKIGQQRYGSAK